MGGIFGAREKSVQVMPVVVVMRVVKTKHSAVVNMAK
jgi:hypothetical protein